MADPTQQPSPSMLQRLAGMLSGGQGASNMGQAGADPQVAMYNNYVRESKAMGETPLPMPQWQAQRAQQFQQRQQQMPQEQAPQSGGFRF